MRRLPIGLLPCLWVGVLVVGPVAPAAAAPALSFLVSSPSPLVGDSIAVDVVATDVTDLFVFNLDLGFDPQVLGVQSVDPGAFLASGGATLGGLGGLGFDLSTPGEIQDVTDSLLGPVPGVTGAGVLARVTFGVVGVGTSPLTFLAVNAPAGTELVNSSGLGIFVSTQPGSVDAVPEPSTGALVAVGLGLLVAHRRRRAAAGTPDGTALAGHSPRPPARGLAGQRVRAREPEALKADPIAGRTRLEPAAPSSSI